MARSSKPTYTIELALHLSVWQQHHLEKKFKIARSVYNSCLGEALKRHKSVKADRHYREWLRKPKTKERDKILTDIRLTYGFSEYGIHKFVKSVQQKFKEHIGSLEAQKLATRAFQSVEKLYFGKARIVHFKNPNDHISVENKSNTTGLRYVDGNILWGVKPTKKNPKTKTWLCIPIVPKDNDEYAHLALMDKNKYVRILTRSVRKKVRYFVQLIQEGYPPTKRHPKITDDPTKRVGLDIGPSTIAISSEDKVELQELAPECIINEREVRVFNTKWSGLSERQTHIISMKMEQ